MTRRFLPLLLLLSFIAACGPAATQPPPTAAPNTVATAASLALTQTAAAPQPIVLTDGLGREVTLAAPAKRVVTLAPSNTEILFALGAGDRLVGRDDFSDFPPEALGVPSIGNLYPSVNAEAIVALQPDLVLAAGVTTPDDVQKLADIGLTVYATQFNVTLDDVYEDIASVGALVGKSAEAEALVAALRERADAVQAKTASAPKPLVFYEVDATEPQKPWTAGSGTFIDNLISLAGGANVGAGTPDYYQISLEELVAQNPDVIVLGSATYGGQTPELVAQRPGWDTLTAVQNNAVYPFDDNLVSRPGPRVVDGLEALAQLIHPELFK